MKLLFSCSARYQIDTVNILLLDTLFVVALTHEIASWTLKEKFLIKAHLCIVFYLLNKDKMADLVMQPRGKSLESYHIWFSVFI